MGVGLGTVAASRFNGPGAPFVAASAPVTGTAASIVATKAYDDSFVDKGLNTIVDNYAEPALATVIDGTISAYNTVWSWFN